MTQVEFEIEFEVLNGFFNATPKKSTAKAWFRRMKEWDIEIFRQIINGYSDAMEDQNGHIKFPHSGLIAKAYAKLTGGVADPEKVDSCLFCLKGKVYLLEHQGEDVYSQPYVFRCGECKPWIFRKLQTIAASELDSWIDRGWRVDPGLKLKHDMVKAGDWKEEGNNTLANQTKALLRGLGFGNEQDKQKEKMRQYSLLKNKEDLPF